MKKTKQKASKKIVTVCGATLALTLMVSSVQNYSIEVGATSTASVLPGSITIKSPTALSGVALPASAYGTLSWASPSTVPGKHSGSYPVVLKVTNAKGVDFSQMKGWNAATGTLSGYVTVVVESLASAPSATPVPTAAVTPQSSTPTPASTPQAAPTGTPQATPTGTPQAAPTGTPGAETTPTGTPQVTPTGTPGAETTPTGTPQATPTGTPEAVTTPTGTPQATPTGTPGAEITPTGTPQAAPTGTPGAETAPTGTPQATPTGTPGAEDTQQTEPTVTQSPETGTQENSDPTAEDGTDQSEASRPDTGESTGDDQNENPEEAIPDTDAVAVVSMENMGTEENTGNAESQDRLTQRYAIAGSNTLVGGEIADSGYGENKPTTTPTATPTARATATAAPTTTSSANVNPVTGNPTSTPASSVNTTSANRVSEATTKRYGVLTGDNTEVAPYAAVGISSALVALLTLFTMRNRKKKQPAEK